MDDGRTASLASPPRAPWLAIAVAFGVVAIMSVIASVTSMRLGNEPVNLVPVILSQAVVWVFWGLITPLVFALGRRFPIRGQRWRRSLAVHAAAAVVVVGCNTAVTVGIGWQTSPFKTPGESITRWVVGYLANRAVWNFILFAGLVFLGQTLDAWRDLGRRRLVEARLEADLARAQLTALQLQLQPHFLFNALHAVGVLTREDPTRASRMIAALGDLLRASLGLKDRQEVPLGEELLALSHYLEIETTRFGDRLSVSVAVAEPLRSLLVPPFLLQPIVENAVRHGISVARGPGRIAVSADREGDSLRLSVWNDGPAVDPLQLKDGIGLATTRDRLARLYQDRASLSLANETGGVRAIVRLPAHDHPIL
jgi:hypothetical protein